MRKPEWIFTGANRSAQKLEKTGVRKGFASRSLLNRYTGYSFYVRKSWIDYWSVDFDFESKRDIFGNDTMTIVEVTV